MKGRKAELSLEVIVIAALAILVLVLLSWYLIKGTKPVGDACINTGGRCVSGEDSSACGPDEQFNSISCGDGMVCCLPVSPEG